MTEQELVDQRLEGWMKLPKETRESHPDWIAYQAKLKQRQKGRKSGFGIIFLGAAGG